MQETKAPEGLVIRIPGVDPNALSVPSPRPVWPEIDRLLLFGVRAMLVSITAAAVLGFWWLPPLKALVLCAVLVGGCAVYMECSKRSTAAAADALSKAPTGEARFDWMIDEAGFSMCSAASNTRIPWTSIVDTVQHEGVLLLAMTPYMVFGAPLGGLSPAERQALEDLLARLKASGAIRGR